MSPDEIRRSWDDDETPRSVFPEPLAERLTRENKELRAEVERLEILWRAQSKDAQEHAISRAGLSDEKELRAFSLVMHRRANDLRAVLDKHAGGK